MSLYWQWRSQEFGLGVQFGIFASQSMLKLDYGK